jgi:uncharacterized protein
MRKRFVLDTNVLFSALLRTAVVSPKVLIKARLEGDLFWPKTTYAEFIDVINRPKLQKYIDFEGAREFIMESQLEGLKALDIEPFITVCRDPKDNKFLDLAVEINADALISGDKDLLVLHPFQGIPIITPADFLTNSF